MKKIVVLFLLASLIIGFAGCKPTGENETMKVYSPNVETTITNYEPEKEKVSYKKIDVNLYGGYITAFGFSDFSPDRMYVALRGGEIYRTDDLGLSWEKIAKLPLSAVQFEGGYQNSDEILSIAESSDGRALFIGTENGVLKSTDSGKTFECCLNGLPLEPYVHSITISKNHSNQVMLSTMRGHFISVDGSSTWNKLQYYTVDYNSANDTLYAVSDYTILKSTDFGKNWVKIDKKLPPFTYFFVLPSNPTTICIVTNDKKMLSTSNDFKDVKEVPFNFPNETAFDINPKDSNFIVGAPGYVNTYAQAKLYISHDGGKTIQTISVFDTFTSVKFSPDGSKFFLLDYNGVLYSSNGGATFKCENVFPEVTFNKIVDVGSKMFALTNSGVFEWDKETNKLTLFEKDGFDRIVDVAYCYTKPDVVYALSTVRLFKLEGRKLTKTVDYDAGRALYVNPVDPQNLAIMGASEQASHWLSVSNDGGKTFNHIEENMQPAIAFDISNPSTIFVISSKDNKPALFKSVDGGKTFSKVAELNLPENSEGHESNIICVDSSTLYAFDTIYGIFKSIDGGKTFVPVNNGLPPVSVKDLKFNPKTGDLFLLTQSYGIFTLKKGGNKWVDISGDLPKDKITAIEIDANTGDVFVGVDGSGIYSLKP